jgi:hypothetical protein
VYLLSKKGRTLALCAAVATTASAAGAGAPYEMDMGAALRECSFLAEEENGYVNVCWAPAELWAHTVSREEGLPGEFADLFSKSLGHYIIITVTAVSVEKPGKVEFASREELSATVRLRDRYGAVYEPVAPGEENTLVRFFARAWEKAIAPQFGPLGGGMNFFFFPAEDAQGRRIASPTAEGTFAVLVGEHEFVWELPLSSFLRPKTCPACGRELSGAYNFCPYDGTELVGQIVEILPEVEK